MPLDVPVISTDGMSSQSSLLGTFTLSASVLSASLEGILLLFVPCHCAKGANTPADKSDDVPTLL